MCSKQNAKCYHNTNESHFADLSITRLGLVSKARLGFIPKPRLGGSKPGDILYVVRTSRTHSSYTYLMRNDVKGKGHKSYAMNNDE